MELFLKIMAAALLGLMLFYLWPVYKRWQEHGAKAEKGDWAAAIVPLGAVAALVIVLIMAVR
ncbi:hypothetical protein [Marichromatium bheemlicum]|uniref:Seryl-tRNA synthetase n=1 Tax=Marichromatium bheemlicum TaxID=365339 RepID=A0ABX1I6W6_9GAMM|nr:hypothetical protein [Marichromatium bheemlicum]NKN33294.1 hypothetical protein [Marichromatium bheemlicum]